MTSKKGGNWVYSNVSDPPGLAGPAPLGNHTGGVYPANGLLKAFGSTTTITLVSLAGPFWGCRICNHGGVVGGRLTERSADPGDILMGVCVCV